MKWFKIYEHNFHKNVLNYERATKDSDGKRKKHIYCIKLTTLSYMQVTEL